MAGIALPTDTILESHSGTFGWQRLARMAGRYSLSAIGPIAVSGAHFAASLIFLHRMAPAEFGVFAFLLVVVPFCLSMSSGLLGAPLVSAIGKSESVGEEKRAAFRAVNRIYCLLTGIATAVLMWTSHAGGTASLLLGLYGAVMAMRWFSRSNAYNQNLPRRAAASDLVYCFCLIAGLLFLVAIDRLSMQRASGVLLASAFLGLLPYGWQFLKLQLRPIEKGAFKTYAPIWRDITRWSLLGVALSEFTANAHAYIVTFISGPQAFALLAAGALLMRPLTLVLSALPDCERPAMAWCLAAGNKACAFAAVHEFRVAAGIAWVGTVLLSIAVLIWYPHLVIRHGFDARGVMTVVAIWGLVVATRAARAGDATFLQAAGEFNGLARAGVPASIVSLVCTLVLLLVAGPIASLAGILAGELVTTVNIFALMRTWRRAHA
jgi:hypothetical protein